METIQKTYLTFNYITVRWQYTGFHKWKDAPDKVAFLRHNHRHKFHAQAQIEVTHDDRELEYFMVLDVIEGQIQPFMFLGDVSSCEQQANFVLEGLKNIYGVDRKYRVDVSEDGENGSGVIWQPR